MNSLVNLYENILQESEEQDLKLAFDVLSRDIDQATQDAEDEVQEGVTTIIGLVLSGPFIVKMFGKFVRFLEKKIAQIKKEEPTQAGNRILAFADKFHHVIMIPFLKLAKLMVKEPAKQKKLANYMFHGTIGLLLIHGGIKIATALESATVNPALALDLAKNGVKSTELISGIKDIIRASMVKIGEDVGEFTS